MINKADIIISLEWLSLPTDKYYLGLGGSMVMQDIKTNTRDLDISVSHELFNELSCTYDTTIAPMGGSMISLLGGLITIFPEDIIPSKIEYLDSYPIETLSSIRNWKQIRGRMKDLMDVKLIDLYLERRRSHEIKSN